MPGTASAFVGYVPAIPADVMFGSVQAQDNISRIHAHMNGPQGYSPGAFFIFRFLRPAPSVRTQLARYILAGSALRLKLHGESLRLFLL